MKKKYHHETNRRRCYGAIKRCDRWFMKLMDGAYLGRVSRRTGYSEPYKRSAFAIALWRYKNRTSLPF